MTECGQQQTGIGRDDGPAKLEHYAAVEIEAKNTVVRFAHRHSRLTDANLRVLDFASRVVSNDFRGVKGLLQEIDKPGRAL